MDGKVYYDEDGETITLESLVRKQPEWAASRIREGDKAIFFIKQLLDLIAFMRRDET